MIHMDFNGCQDREPASRFPKGCNTHPPHFPFFVFFLLSYQSLFTSPAYPPKAECGLESWVEGRDTLLPLLQGRAAEHQGTGGPISRSAPGAPGVTCLPSPLSLQAPFPAPSPPEPNANLIYDVCTEEMTLRGLFKSSCHQKLLWPGSLLISIPFLLKLKAFFPAREQLLKRGRPGPHRWSVDGFPGDKGMLSPGSWCPEGTRCLSILSLA